MGVLRPTALSVPGCWSRRSSKGDSQSLTHTRNARQLRWGRVSSVQVKNERDASAFAPNRKENHLPSPHGRRVRAARTGGKGGARRAVERGITERVSLTNEDKQWIDQRPAGRARG